MPATNVKFNCLCGNCEKIFVIVGEGADYGMSDLCWKAHEKGFNTNGSREMLIAELEESENKELCL